MCIYLLRCRALVETDEPMQEIITRGVVVRPAREVGEVIRQRRNGKFLSEEVDLIEEKYLRRRRLSRGAEKIKEGESLR